MGAAFHLDDARHTDTIEGILNIAEGHVACAAAIDLFEDVTDMRTMRRWRFKPAFLDSEPVPVRISVDMKFALR